MGIGAVQRACPMGLGSLKASGFNGCGTGDGGLEAVTVVGKSYRRLGRSGGEVAVTRMWLG